MNKNSYCKRLYIIVLFTSSLLINCSKKADVTEAVTKPININESSSFLIKETYLSDTERLRLHRRQGIADFISTGLFIKPHQKIEISRKLITGNNNPQILIGGYSRNLSYDQPEVINIGNLTESFYNSSDHDAQIFIRYSNENPTSESKITIKKGYKTPTFQFNETTNEEFVAMLNEYSYEDVILRSEKACVLISKKTALKYKNQNWNKLLTTINEIINIEAYIDGLDSSKPVHVPNRNKYYFTETNDDAYWMAATTYRTFYNNTDAIDFLISVSLLQNDGWGPWHELGHQHQISSLTWSGVSEVTVNIYSLAIERYFNHESRLKRDGVWSKVFAYLDTPIETRDYNQQLDAFEKLAMYQQLWLKYGDNFFINLHKKAREEAKELSSNEQKMAYFILKASEVSGNNLNIFFKEWGLKLPVASFEAIDNLNLPLPTEDLTLLQD
jgi:hypothetical protein|tara:strand:- start:6279 stop:7607 length:1329 start_codon:yes stop_codon:yes gene_type:complete